jgi:hypothetical protein
LIRVQVEQNPKKRQRVADVHGRGAVGRRPVDRPVATGDAVFQEKAVEASERSEEAVVDKQARVVEEIGIRKDVDTRTETVRDTVRKKAEVEDDRSVGRGRTGDEEPLTTGTARDRRVD